MKLNFYVWKESDVPELAGEMIQEIVKTVPIVPGSSPTLRNNARGDLTEAAFSLTEAISEDDFATVDGISVCTDDDMLMNEVIPSAFLRHELYMEDEETGRTRLRFTNEPIPVPPPPPPEQTYEEQLMSLRQMKREEIMMSRDSVIQNGIWVETAFGIEHFTLNEKDQILLLGINAMVMQGITSYPYHSVSAGASDTNICTIYSDKDIANIAVNTFAHVTFHESYANMILQWVNRETDLEVLKGIAYNCVLPEDLLGYLAMIITSAGIDPLLIPGYVPPVLPWQPGVFTVAPQASAHVTMAAEQHCEILVKGINVLPCVKDVDTFGVIKDPVCIELSVDIPMEPGENVIIEQINPLLGLYYADDPFVEKLPDSDIWHKKKKYTMPENPDDPIFTYSLLVGGKMEADAPQFPEIYMNIYKEDGETLIMSYTITSTLEFGDGTDIPDPDEFRPVEPDPEEPTAPEEGSDTSDVPEETTPPEDTGGEEPTPDPEPVPEPEEGDE